MAKCCACTQDGYDPLNDVLSHELDSGRERRKAQDWAAAARSWAVGGTGRRGGEDTDNAKYYAGQAAQAVDAAGTNAGRAETAAGEAANAGGAAQAAAAAAAASAGSAKADADIAKENRTAAGAAADRADAAADKAQAIVGFDPDTKQDDLAEEHHTVELTNTRHYPQNNSKKTVNLTTTRVNGDYTVDARIAGVTLPNSENTVLSDGDTAGVAGHIVITDKLVNGFKVEYTGAAKAATVELIVRGGMG